MYVGIDKRDIRGILFSDLYFFEQNAIVHNKVEREVILRCDKQSRGSEALRGNKESY